MIFVGSMVSTAIGLMELPHTMTTLSRVLERLEEKGICREFRWTRDGFCLEHGNYYQPHELLIIRIFRFEGITDPADMSVLYLIRTNDGQTGYSLNAYGVYSSHDGEDGYDNFIRRVPERNHEEQHLFSL
jgi:hypothetical protein